MVCGAGISIASRSSRRCRSIPLLLHRSEFSYETPFVLLQRWGSITLSSIPRAVALLFMAAPVCAWYVPGPWMPRTPSEPSPAPRKLSKQSPSLTRLGLGGYGPANNGRFSRGFSIVFSHAAAAARILLSICAQGSDCSFQITDHANEFRSRIPPRRGMLPTLQKNSDQGVWQAVSYFGFTYKQPSLN